jgi:hypothetical protein
MKTRCNCTHGGQFPLQGEGFSRRRFLRVAGTSVVASWFADVFDPRLLLAETTSANVRLLNTAKNVIFIFLQGAPSQIDTFDLKEGAWTPAEFQPTSYGDVRWPKGLLPKTAEHLSKLGIVRCGLAWAAVHGLAQTWAMITRNPSGVNANIAPHIGAVVALEAQASRGPADVLPGFIGLNTGAIPRSGYLPAKYAPFAVQADPNGLTTLKHPEGAARFDSRWELLQKLDLARSNGSLAKASMDMHDFYLQSEELMRAPGINELFSFSEADRQRYGSSPFGDSLIVARNLVGANRGVRFVQVTLGGWDHHDNIYARQSAQSIWAQAGDLDDGFSALLTDLETTGKLDETLIVVEGEFGRTVGPLNKQSGRDHFLRNSIVFAGGGVKGGRIIGKTDANGDKALEYQWSANRDVRPEDVTCTIYSALGIDYTTVRTDDPLGRGFEYVPFAKDGHYQAVEELF